MSTRQKLVIGLLFLVPGMLIAQVTGLVWPVNHGDADVCLWGEDKIAALTIGVDDNCAPDHDWWLSMQQKYDFTMTWWVVTGGVDGSNAGFNGTWDDFKKLHAAGNEIASHSNSHDCDMGSADYDNELRISKSKIEAGIGGGYQCRTYAGPCGNEAPQSIREKYYIAQRGVKGGTNGALSTNFNSSKVVSSGPDKVFDPSDILTPGVFTWIESYRGWRIHFYHYLNTSGRPGVENNLLKPMHANRSKLWVAPYGAVAMYMQERNTATLIVTSKTASAITFSLTDRVDNALFDYPLCIKVRVHNDWSTLTAVQNGVPVDAEIITYSGNKYVLVNVVPDRGAVTISSDGSTGGGGDPVVIEPPTVIEAEDMTLTGYMVDMSKMSGAGIMVDPGLGVPATGTATATFTGSSGTYDITFNVAPENDGEPVIKLYVAGKKVWEDTYPMNSSFYNAATDRVDLKASGIAIAKGDEIKIEGTSDYAVSANAAAFARVDKITLQPLSTGIYGAGCPVGLSGRLTDGAWYSVSGKRMIGPRNGTGVYIVHSAAGLRKEVLLK